jgi:phage N-6-adenine-methyltransferase
MSKNIDALFSSKTDQWATPQNFFDEINEEFGFTLDPCADYENHKCEKYFTAEENGLKQNWGGTGYFVTRHTEQRSKTGLRNVMKRDTRKIHLLHYLYQQERIQNIFMIIF